MFAAIPNYCNTASITTPPNSLSMLASNMNATISSTTTFTCADGYTGNGKELVRNKFITRIFKYLDLVHAILLICCTMYMNSR